MPVDSKAGAPAVGQFQDVFESFWNIYGNHQNRGTNTARLRNAGVLGTWGASTI